MTPQELKASILQLAVQGKLVEHHPEEGTGEELFRQIQAEKQYLIKTGTIKKEKPLPEISEDEISFDLPNGWCWARLESICSLITDGTHKTPSYTTSGVRFLSVKDISNGYLDLSNTKYISKSEHAQLTQRCKPEIGDVLICRIGTLGKALSIDINLEFSIFVSLGLIKPVHKELAQYIETVINSGYGYAWIQRVKVGGGTHTFKINLDDLRMFPIPLPPLAEQKRIIAKIEELLPYIDRYEQAWSRLEEFNKRFPVDMQKSILQMAIQGKLVEQHPEEGTGEELYQQIQAEKQRLIKAGVFKKDKALPDITEDDILFDIPDTWRWCYVGEIFDHNTGKAMNASAKKVDKLGSIRKFITTSNLYWDSFDFTTVKEMFFSDDELARCTATKKDILMCEGGAYYGRTAIWNYDYDICFQNHIHRLRAYAEVDERFFYYVFRFYRETGMMQSQGTAMPGLSSVVLHNMMIPLPPISEQKRIIAKLEEILPLCERLK